MLAASSRPRGVCLARQCPGRPSGRRRLVVLLAAGVVAAATARTQPRVPEPLPRPVEITGIPGVIEAGARWRRAWHGIDNADGLVGTDDGGLLFAQEQPRRVGRLDTDDGYSIYLSGTRGVGSLSMDRTGRLWGVERSCTDPGRRAASPCAEPTAIAVLTPERRVLADAFADGRTLGRLNDLTVDRHGGAYFTVGGAYHAAPDGRISSLGDDLRTNGIVLSPDERTLYVTNRETVVAFDVADDGSARNRRDFARLEAGGTGDGMTVDAESRLYVTSRPGVQVFDPAGRFLGLIPTPRPAISIAFAGDGKQTLYVVGSGASLGPNGSEFETPEGVRNNAKTIYRVRMLARGYGGRAK
jgi:gluconolactonase